MNNPTTQRFSWNAYIYIYIWKSYWPETTGNTFPENFPNLPDFFFFFNCYITISLLGTKSGQRYCLNTLKNIKCESSVYGWVMSWFRGISESGRQVLGSAVWANSLNDILLKCLKKSRTTNRWSRCRLQPLILHLCSIGLYLSLIL